MSDKKELNPLDNKKQERIKSSMMLFFDACKLWGRIFNNDDLVVHIQEAEDNFKAIDFNNCSEESIQLIERATSQLLTNMDNTLKSLGLEGITYKGTKH